MAPRHVCSICEREFPKPWRLAEHMSQHTGERPFHCDETGCDKSFIRASHLKRHKLSHTGEKPFTCPHDNCSLKFTTSTHLKRHLALHDKPKPFVCTFEGCSEAFSKHLQLRKHEFVHTGVRAFSCSHEGCSDSFDSASKLERHSIKHTDLPRYVCAEEDCNNAGFATWSQLNEHKQAMHRPDVYQCSSCPKIFRERKHWKAHIMIHDENRPRLVCTYPDCSELFISRRNLRHHIQSFHEGPKAQLKRLRVLAQEEATTRKRLGELASTDLIMSLTGHFVLDTTTTTNNNDEMQIVQPLDR